MTRTALLFSLALAATPLAAEEHAQGRSLMEEGARLFLEGLMSEMEPALEELEGFAQEMQPLMQDFLSEMGPALTDLMREVEDWSVYEAPEMLPNGDIIIRRKAPLEEPADEIEL